MRDCGCDYSYTCEACQTKIDVENQKQYNEEVKEWMLACMIEISKALNITLPEPPQRRR